MFCSKCGTQLRDGDKYCSVCGNEIPLKKINDNNVQTKRKKFIWYTIGIAVCILVLSLIGITKKSIKTIDKISNKQEPFNPNKYAWGNIDGIYQYIMQNYGEEKAAKSNYYVIPRIDYDYNYILVQLPEDEVNNVPGYILFIYNCSDYIENFCVVRATSNNLLEEASLSGGETVFSFVANLHIYSNGYENIWTNDEEIGTISYDYAGKEVRTVDFLWNLRVDKNNRIIAFEKADLYMDSDELMDDTLLGNVWDWVSALVDINLAYNKDNTISSTSHGTDDSVIEYVYSYDNDGNILSLVLKSEGIDIRTITNEYDNGFRTSSTIMPSEDELGTVWIWTFLYDTAGNPESIKLYEEPSKSYCLYNTKYQLISEVLEDGYHYDYVYDENCNLILETEYDENDNVRCTSEYIFEDNQLQEHVTTYNNGDVERYIYEDGEWIYEETNDEDE